MDGKPGWLGEVSGFTPSHLLEAYRYLGTFKIFEVFGNVIRTLDVCILMYLILSVILVPLMYREFQRIRE